jgi:hypothetical protein
MLHRVVWKKLAEVSEMHTASIMMVMMMEAIITSETSASFYQTTERNTSENSNLHIRHQKKLKSRLETLTSLGLYSALVAGTA